jgi:hypothetical protein
VENGLLTPMLKLEPPVLLTRLAKEIEAAYDESPG